MATSKTKFGTWDELMEGVDTDLRQIAEALRTTVFTLHPDATEVVRLGDRASCLGYGPKKMSEAHCYIMPHKKWINLGFFYGALLDDPDELLEGTGKKLRHVKVRSLEAANNPAVKALIQAAMAERKAALGL